MPQVIGAGVRHLLRHPDSGFYLVAESGGEVIAGLLMTTEWSDWRNGEFWWIRSVYVRPEYRRQGVYRRLYRFVRALAAKKRGVCGFRLYVEQGNRRARPPTAPRAWDARITLCTSTSSPACDDFT